MLVSGGSRRPADELSPPPRGTRRSTSVAAAARPNGIDQRRQRRAGVCSVTVVSAATRRQRQLVGGPPRATRYEHSRAPIGRAARTRCPRGPVRLVWRAAIRPVPLEIVYRRG